MTNSPLALRPCLAEMPVVLTRQVGHVTAVVTTPRIGVGEAHR
jgi:hypothetical protein